MSIRNTLKANWKLAGHVHTLITQKNTCFSQESDIGTFGFNLANHVGDELEKVEQRRALLQQHLSPCAPVQWLQQVHGDQVLCLDEPCLDGSGEQSSLVGDACFSFQTHAVCALTTADCLPILLSDTPGHFVGAIHAGWQGLYKGIIGKTLYRVREKAKQKQIVLGDLQAYIGPAISQQNYQVDELFFDRFVSLEKAYQDCFEADGDSKYRADIKAIARLQLLEAGVSCISDSGICTYQSPDFYSYRRANHLGDPQCGRFASLIYLSGLPAPLM